ncbi:MAG: hypothetical protein K6G16_01290 [Lachnospiraceae bacterium]|nr:hypothetical protein [Lachnospiraceae bacterium]
MSFAHAFFGFVPRHIPNSLTLFVYDLLSRHGRLPSFSAPVPGCGSGEDLPETREPVLIEDQRRRAQEPFGRSTVAHAGCEVIALYNALSALYGREIIPFPELIRLFRHRGMALGGRWGTSPRSLFRFLVVLSRQCPLRIEATSDLSRFEELAERYSCLILSFFNDGGDIRRGVHTVCLTRTAGGFVAHNLTEDGKPRGPFSDVTRALANAGGGRARGLYLIGVGKNG